MRGHEIMRGFPVPPEGRVPRGDWDRPPWNRWAFQHIREILPTVEVWRGQGPVWRLPYAIRDLESLPVSPAEGRQTTLGRWLEEDFTDGFIVLHRGAIVLERYLNGMTERTLHLSQSVAKSVTGTVAGILAGRGLIDPEGQVTDYLPELKRTAWKGAKLRHVLDMTSGVRFSEDYEDPHSDVGLTDIASGWKPRLGRRKVPACMWDQILGLKVKECEHGAKFRYRSIETDVLAHCLERAGGLRFADLVSRELWQRLGAEESACFTVDAAGYPLADGGFNATLRDYARFGLMHLHGGVADGRRVLPLEWIEDTRRGDPSLFGAPYTDVLPRGAYRNKFWIADHRRRAYMARGVFGQRILIDPDLDLVIVKLSSWPTFQSLERSVAFQRVAEAIGEVLASGT